MRVDPSTVGPGERVALRFDPVPAHRWRRSARAVDDVRGVAWSLSVRDGAGWRVAFWLTSDGNGDEPSWWSEADSEGRGWPDVGVSGSGPDHLTIPTTAVNGDYLLRSADDALSDGGELSLRDIQGYVPAISSSVMLHVRT